LRLTGENVLIPRRYRGPSDSGNGGYTCGLVASLLGASAAEVTLRVPPPLETPLGVERDDGRVRLWDGGTLVAEGVPSGVDVQPPVVTWAQAEAATARYTGFDEHEFPECFVCGPARGRGDGLRIFPGEVRPGLVAAPWVAREVAPEVVWAAIDCPGAFGAGYAGRGTVLLGRMAARVDRLPGEGEPCVALGWSLGAEGRKLFAGTALLGADGRACAVGRQVWVEPRTTTPTRGAA
jgi:hypothetical protein